MSFPNLFAEATRKSRMPIFRPRRSVVLVTSTKNRYVVIILYFSFLGYRPDFLKFLSYHRPVDNKKLGREIELTLTCCEAPGRWSGGRNNSGLRTQTEITAWPRWSQWAGRVATARTPGSAQQSSVSDPACSFLTSEFNGSHFRLKTSYFEKRNSQKISSRNFWKNVINSLE